MQITTKEQMMELLLRKAHLNNGIQELNLRVHEQNKKLEMKKLEVQKALSEKGIMQLRRAQLLQDREMLQREAITLGKASVELSKEDQLEVLAAAKEGGLL